MPDEPTEKPGDDKTDALLKKLVQVPKRELAKAVRKKRRRKKKK